MRIRSGRKSTQHANAHREMQKKRLADIAEGAFVQPAWHGGSETLSLARSRIPLAPDSPYFFLTPRLSANRSAQCKDKGVYSRPPPPPPLHPLYAIALSFR